MGCDVLHLVWLKIVTCRLSFTGLFTAILCQNLLQIYDVMYFGNQLNSGIHQRYIRSHNIAFCIVFACYRLHIHKSPNPIQVACSRVVFGDTSVRESLFHANNTKCFYLLLYHYAMTFCENMASVAKHISNT